MTEVEKVARAIADYMHRGGDWGMTGEDAYEARMSEFHGMAQAALAALGEAEPVAESPGPWPNEADFELWQNDEFAAGASGPRNDAIREILHYAAVYGQDGPVTIYEVKRVPVDAAAIRAGSEG